MEDCVFLLKLVPHWLTPERSKPALVTGLALFFISYFFDLVLYKLGVPAAATILNNVAIGLLGALILIFYLSTLHFEQNHLRARERMILVAELNHHVRNALTIIQYSASLEDREERVRRVGEAVERIDHVLMDLVPTAASAEGPRYFFPEQN
jgi:hypothetical protein